MTILLSSTTNKKAKRVGRGSKRGKTSGRGTKGQKARAGHRIRPHIRDIIKKLPKLRGRGKNSNKVFAVKSAVVNLSVLEILFTPQARVTPSALLAKGAIARVDGKLPPVKILGNGTLSKPLTVYECEVSSSAKEKIAAAGGKVA
ncbi:50S ribosomal protein L15 [Candidatus Nomurabacteria bacterium]|nr:50S ribosomal protein L15 [Candidatus Nomurabacteria bacterium]